MHPTKNPILRARIEQGRVVRGKPLRPAIDRFLDFISPEPMSGCWLWTGMSTGGNDGYGCFKAFGQKILAHRFSFNYFVGEIPEGMVLDHLCRVHSCVNPCHLEVVTHQENCVRGDHRHNVNRIGNGRWMAAKTHCPRGHPYDGANTYLYKGRRQCRICRRSKASR